MHPSKPEHETVFVVEAQTGIPINVEARFQVKIKSKKKYLSSFIRT
jgi:hypothetical protein